MKRIIILLLFIFSCSPQEDEDITIRSDYNGEYYIFVQNADNEENAVFIKGTTGSYELSNDKMVDVIGEPVYLKIAAIKVVGSAFPDMGPLTVGIYDGDDLIVSDTAEVGDIEADLDYML